MVKFKRLVLSLCLVSLFSVGFLSVDSFAAEKYENSFPVKFTSNNAFMRLRGSAWENVQQEIALIYDENTNTYISNNVNANNVTAIQIGSSGHQGYIDFTFIPSLYEYYFVSTVVADTDVSNFTFVPYRQTIVTYDCDTGYVNNRALDFSVYHHDTANKVGFTTITKLPDLDNTAIGSFHFSSSSASTVPANLNFTGLILAVGKQETVDLGYITNLLENINTNTGSTVEQLQSIQSFLEKQYEIAYNEDFGVNDLTPQVEEKLGVLNFTSDTLVGFLDLFDSSSAGSTELVFPAFKLTMADGQSYQVWNDITYDLRELENQFGFLINTVRTITVLIVWLAVLRYLGVAYEHFINKR